MMILIIIYFISGIFFLQKETKHDGSNSDGRSFFVWQSFYCFLTTKHIAIGKTELGNSQTLINLKF